MKAAAFILLVMLGSGGQMASAQSLGEIAEKEKERRAALKTQSVERSTPVRVYGQNDVKTAMTSDDTGVVEGQSGKSSAAAASVANPAAPDTQAAEQQLWRSKADAIRAEIAAADKDVRAMEALGPGLTVPLPDALVQARGRLATAKQQLDALEERARQSGVPPGWVR
jgi:hypothetical protein